MAKKKSTVGGKREGAGRKPLPPGERLVAVAHAFPPDLLERLAARAEAEGISRSRFVVEAVEARLATPVVPEYSVRRAAKRTPRK